MRDATLEHSVPAATATRATDNRATRYVVLAGALIVQSILGTLYGYSIFWRPLEQVIFPPTVTAQQAQERGLDAGAVRPGERVTVDTDAGSVVVVASAADAERLSAEYQGYLKYAFSIAVLAFAVTMVIAGRIQDVTGPRIPALIGAALIGTGFILAGFMKSAVVFYISHSALMGLLALVLLLLFHAVTARVDPKENPMVQWAPFGIMTMVIVLGVGLSDRYVGEAGPFNRLMVLWGTVGVLAGCGIGFAYVCPIAALVKWFPEYKGLVTGLAVAGFGLGAFIFKGDTIGAKGFLDEHGIMTFFIVHGFVCLLGISFGALLLKNPVGAPKGTASRDSGWQDTLKRPAFYVLWLMFFSASTAGLMVIGILAPFVREQVLKGGVDALQAGAVGATAVGVLAIFNAAGRVVWGVLSDKIGRTLSFILIFVAQGAVMFVLASLKGATALYVAAGLVGFNYGGIFALLPSATADMFGSKNLGANYGWVFTSYGIAGIVGVAAGNVAKEQTGDYRYAFWMAAGLCLISAVLALVLRPMAAQEAARVSA